MVDAIAVRALLEVLFCRDPSQIVWMVLAVRSYSFYVVNMVLNARFFGWPPGFCVLLADLSLFTWCLVPGVSATLHSRSFDLINTAAFNALAIPGMTISSMAPSALFAYICSQPMPLGLSREKCGLIAPTKAKEAMQVPSMDKELVLK